MSESAPFPILDEQPWLARLLRISFVLQVERYWIQKQDALQRLVLGQDTMVKSTALVLVLDNITLQDLVQKVFVDYF